VSFKHTTGPWRYETETQTVRTVPGNHCVVSIREFTDDGATDAYLIPNGPERLGRLIAAAPELLVACEGALAALLFAPHVDKQQAVDYLREVLAKVDGEET
jgi:hypothetical protein